MVLLVVVATFRSAYGVCLGSANTLLSAPLRSDSARTNPYIAMENHKTHDYEHFGGAHSYAAMFASGELNLSYFSGLK